METVVREHLERLALGICSHWNPQLVMQSMRTWLKALDDPMWIAHNSGWCVVFLGTDLTVVPTHPEETLDERIEAAKAPLEKKYLEHPAFVMFVPNIEDLSVELP